MAKVDKRKEREMFSFKMRKITITNGETYGKLTVIRELPNDDREDRQRFVLCRCECGNEKPINLYRMKYGSIKSCGCVSKGRKAVDFTGRKFNKLTAIKEVDREVKSTGTVRRYLFRCECGVEKVIPLNSVKNGGTRSVKSCGCLKKNPKRKHNIKKGDRFNSLTVIKELEKNKNQRRVLCRCDCGTEKSIALDSLTSGSTRSCGCLRSKRYDKDSLVNKQFGQLRVIAQHGVTTESKKRKRTWRCVCSCGNERIVTTSALKSGSATTCGNRKIHARRCDSK